MVFKRSKRFKNPLIQVESLEVDKTMAFSVWKL